LGALKVTKMILKNNPLFLLIFNAIAEVFEKNCESSASIAKTKKS